MKKSSFFYNPDHETASKPGPGRRLGRQRARRPARYIYIVYRDTSGSSSGRMRRFFICRRIHRGAKPWKSRTSQERPRGICGICAVIRPICSRYAALYAAPRRGKGRFWMFMRGFHGIYSGRTVKKISGKGFPWRGQCAILSKNQRKTTDRRRKKIW